MIAKEKIKDKELYYILTQY